VRIQLLISDDGTGFDLAAAAPGHGLSALQRQAAAAGGRLDVTSAPGSGTSVTAQLP
jgi:signal transduction histidine kinase